MKDSTSETDSMAVETAMDASLGFWSYFRVPTFYTPLTLLRYSRRRNQNVEVTELYAGGIKARYDGRLIANHTSSPGNSVIDQKDSRFFTVFNWFTILDALACTLPLSFCVDFGAVGARDLAQGGLVSKESRKKENQMRSSKKQIHLIALVLVLALSGAVFGQDL